MHQNKFAFKQGYSAEAALHNVVQKHKKAVFNKQLTLFRFLDIEGAYSKVSLTTIWMALINAKVQLNLVTGIMRMLKSQWVNATLRDSSISVRLIKGKARGVLSPCLLYTSDAADE